MKHILDKLHNREGSDDDINGKGRKRKPKRSLRGLDIVHILPDAFPPAGNSSTRLHNGSTGRVTPDSSSTISSTHSSDTEDDGRHQLDDFIHSHYHFLEGHHDSLSSHYESTRGSDSNKSATVRFTDTQPQRQSATSDIKRRNVAPKQYLAETNNMSTEKTRRNSRVEKNTQHESKDLGNDLPAPDYDQEPSGSTKSVAPRNHLDELKLRFSLTANGGLKSPTDDNLKSPTDDNLKSPDSGFKSPTDHKLSSDSVTYMDGNIRFPVTTGRLKFPATIGNNNQFYKDSKVPAKIHHESINSRSHAPTNPMEELKLRFSGLGGPPSPPTAMSTQHDDTYLIPVRSSGVIKLG